ncbi:hypothetical protein KO495_12090 [Colwellia sp. D2M02]|uniref:toxin VasX n=1 Tax=Colwellia sp. D2M02 TaxID=2841562 RepID=UPI001C08865F|nr:toxin VasX [Colwellia sp. D2M02]MBU2894052.1 hypothetical protein [Colwellia sp. D2M02]
MNAATNNLAMAVNKTNKLIVGKKVTPIYPVRYAYANFFEETLSNSAIPVELYNLLYARTIKEGQGYIVRLLRKGWIYLCDDDDPASDKLHIFKYEKRKDEKGVASEHFIKYKFKNGIDASQGIEIDTNNKCASSSDGSYGFVFASEDVKKVSIVYTEHELALDIIDKIQSDVNFRRECMQLIDLQQDQGQDFIPVTESNLWKLIEDYRDRKDRFLQVQASEKANQEELNLENLTTEHSYELDADHISLRINHTLRFSEKSKIVALFDPVGRQKDIALAHAQLCILQQAESAQNVYPYTIGSFVQALRSSKDEEIKEALAENINWQEHGNYWQEMDENQQNYLARQQEFVDLYKAFMGAAEHQNQVGSLNTYLKSFFAEPEQNAEQENELVKLCDVCTDMFAGMLASEPGNKALEKLFIDGAEQAENNDNSSPMAMFWYHFLRPIITQPQKGTDFTANTLQVIDRLMLNIMAPIISKVYSPTKVSMDYAKKLFGLSAGAGLNYIANKVVPAILGVYGVQILDKKVALTEQQLEKLINKTIRDANLNQHLRVSNPQTAERYVGSAERKIKVAQTAFDWVEAIKDAKLPTLITLSEIKVDARNYNNYAFVHSPYSNASKIAILVDGSFAGLSAYFNIAAMNDLIHQNRLDSTNPLKSHSTFQTVMTWTSILSALTVDIATIGSDTIKMGHKAVQAQPKLLQPKAMQALKPLAKNLNKSLGVFLAGKATTRLILVANIAGAVSSTMSAINAFNVGSDEEAYGHLITMAGSAALATQVIFFGSSALYASGVSAATIGGAPVSILLLIGGLIAIGAGISMTFIFGKNDLELLLANCFWGNGSKYAFWITEDERPSINDRLKEASTIYKEQRVSSAYQVELQEFENIFNRPSLTLEHKDDKSDYNFTLPNFRLGISQLYFEVRVNKRVLSDGIIKPNTLSNSTSDFSPYVTVREVDLQLTQSLKQQFNAIKHTFNSGLTQFTLTLEHEKEVFLYWYYEPSPGAIVPKRYLVENQLVDGAIIGMLDDNFMPETH